jgi:hypothetical protein
MHWFNFGKKKNILPLLALKAEEIHSSGRSARWVGSAVLPRDGLRPETAIKAAPKRPALADSGRDQL